MQHGSAKPPAGQTVTLSATQSASIAAQFRYYGENRLLDFRYTLTNHSSGERLAVFDRGSIGGTLDAVGPTGKVARPTIQIGNGDATLSFQSSADAAGPETRLLALDLAPNGSVQVEAWETLPGTDAVRRVRLCVPVAPLAAGDFAGGIDSKDGPVRTATGGTPQGLQLLCSDWVELVEDSAEWTD